MIARIVPVALVASLLIAAPARAQDALVTYKSMSPELALDLAGPHTVPTAASKAWTAVSFRTNTSDLIGVSQPGMPQAGLRNLPGAVILGGGVMVEAGGTMVGAVGVSGAPGGEADDSCAKAGIETVRDRLEF